MREDRVLIQIETYVKLKNPTTKHKRIGPVLQRCYAIKHEELETFVKSAGVISNENVEFLVEVLGEVTVLEADPIKPSREKKCAQSE